MLRNEQISVPLGRAAHPSPGSSLLRPSRRNVVFGGLGLIGLAGISTPAYAGYEAAEELVITRYRLNPPRWRAGHRLTIAVVADLHAGGPNMGLRRVEQVVEATNALK